MPSRTTPPRKGDQASYLPTSNSGSTQRATSSSAAADTSSSRAGGAGAVAAQQNQYRPGSPIRFYDDEVERMRREVDKQAPKDRRDARRELRSRPRCAHKRGVTVTGFFLRAAALYLLIAYFFVCPEDPKGERAVCRALSGSGARLRQYGPLVQPYVAQVQHHIEPYWLETKKHLRPYYEAVEPYYQRVDRLARPQVATARRLYAERVLPVGASTFKRLQSAVKPVTSRLTKQYQKSIAPSVEWYGESLHRQYSPYLQRADELRRQHVVPLVSNGLHFAQDTASRGQHHWKTHLVPFSRQAYSTSRKTYVTQVHPRAVTLTRHAVHFWRTRVLPTLLRFWSRFIAPQLDKIRERIFEYKSKKAKLDAIERVEKAGAALAEEQKADEVEEFINDLRDEKLPSQPEPEAEAPPAYSATNAPPPPSPEDAAKLRAEKRAALEARHTTYEQEIAKLGQAEYSLLVDRLVELREQAQKDITDRFEASLESLDDEGDLMVGRLGRYFARVGANLREDEVEAKAREADELAVKAQARVDKKAKAIKAEVAEYRSELQAKEIAAVEQAKAAVTDLVDKAQSELGQGWTWLDGVTAKDWQRYHGLRDAEKNLHSRFADLHAGAIKESRLATPEPHALLDYFNEQPDKLVDAFEKILNKIKVRGQRELKGEWLGVVPEAQKAMDAATGKVGAVVGDVKASASSLAGYEAQPTNVVESASSIASVAQASASSLASAAASALPTVQSPQEYVSTVKSTVAEASQQVLRAVGIEPSPTDLKQTATSVAQAASSSASSVIAAASQSVVRAVGEEPSPTDLPQAATSLAKVASSSASSVASQVISDYPSSVSSVIDSATRAAEQAASTVVGSAASLASSASKAVSSSIAAPAASAIKSASVQSSVGSASERVGEALGDASQAVLRAVGVEPSPTNVKQSATSVIKAASSSVSSAASVVSSLASPHSSFRPAAQTPSIVASASSLVSSVSSVASSLAQPHPSYSKSEAAASASSATRAVKQAVRHVEL
ncbi:hypothetical protein JCM10908_002000 [Rhodotorula pacifica]|uniref:uncharacterized protein n=1 Tax=Rhodotorula pacifica TaxID=1495444 RepID=UPI00316B1CF0